MEGEIVLGWETMYSLHQRGLAKGVLILTVGVEGLEVRRVMPKGENDVSALNVLNEQLVVLY